MDPVTSYLQTFEALRRQKRWSTNTMVLRFAALSLASAELSDPHAQLEKTASELRRRAGWFGPLRSDIRYMVAAMLLRRGLSAAKVHPQVVRTRKALRQYRLPRSSISATFAALLLVLHEDGAAVPVLHLQRMESIYQCWKQEHRFLTGQDDLPAAALHAVRDESAESLSQRVEEAYRSLHRAGFRRGNPLQLVSHIMALDGRGLVKAVERFRRITQSFQDGGMRISGARYDEVAILALLQEPPAKLAQQVLGYFESVRAARPRPGKEIAFSLAAGIALAAEARRLEGAGSLPALNMLQNVQSILDAQAAAMAAAAAAAGAAAAAS
jgi:hypothetical protein